MPVNYGGNPALFPPLFQIPSDGDQRDATSVDVAIEALGDRTAYLKDRAVVATYYDQDDIDFGGAEPFATYVAVGYTYVAPISSLVTTCRVGDGLLINFKSSVIMNDPGAGGLRLATTQDFGGAAVNAAIPGSSIRVTNNGMVYTRAVSMSARVIIGTAGDCRVEVEGKVDAAGNPLLLLQSWSIMVEHVRLF